MARIIWLWSAYCLLGIAFTAYLARLSHQVARLERQMEEMEQVVAGHGQEKTAESLSRAREERE
ncbi:MAG: hypothetical protein IMX01_02940 [Limnochordaceae bacterium]|nr:hypothetical protein [Limnochordaceae bacterium]